jgi:hypothetical protein
MQTMTKQGKMADLWWVVLVLGSLWGFSEVVLSAAIGAAGLPYRSAILAGVGMGLMAIAVAMVRKPLPLLGIAVVTMAVKQLVVPILQVSLSCKANSCLAVSLEAMALAGTVAVAGRRLDRSAVARVIAPASAALLSAGAFHYLGIRFAPCNYLLSFNRPGGLLAFYAAEGVPWAVASALLFPLGYRLGEWLRENAPALRTRQPLAYYTTHAALVLGSWLASAAVIAAGF